MLSPETIDKRKVDCLLFILHIIPTKLTFYSQIMLKSIDSVLLLPKTIDTNLLTNVNPIKDTIMDTFKVQSVVTIVSYYRLKLSKVIN